MIELSYSPAWFSGKDLIIDMVRILILSMVGFFGLKFFFWNKSKKYLLFGIAMLTIAAAFFFKFIMNFTLSMVETHIIDLPIGTLTRSIVEPTAILFFVGFFFYRLFLLFGLYILYSVYEKQTWSGIILTSFLLIISTSFSLQSQIVFQSLLVFHLIALILSGLITFKFYKLYQANKTKAGSIIAFAFLIITLSFIPFLFLDFESSFYVAAEILALIGYMVLLLGFILVVKNGKKKN